MKTSNETWASYSQRRKRQLVEEADEIFQRKLNVIRRAYEKSGGNKYHAWRAAKMGADVDYSPYDYGDKPEQR